MPDATYYPISYQNFKGAAVINNINVSALLNSQANLLANNKQVGTLANLSINVRHNVKQITLPIFTIPAKQILGANSYQTSTNVVFSSDIFQEINTPTPTGNRVLVTILKNIINLLPDQYIKFIFYASYTEGNNQVEERLLKIGKCVYTSNYSQPYKPSDF